MRIYEHNRMQLEAYLQRDDRVVVPLGCTEQHACLSLGTDSILAERVALEAGASLLPERPSDQEMEALLEKHAVYRVIRILVRPGPNGVRFRRPSVGRKAEAFGAPPASTDAC
ncbi:MAG TPA: creatininase family protein [Meiothermus sp.]|nr:creatininase family protein [Meiothermus sp.]